MWYTLDGTSTETINRIYLYTALVFDGMLEESGVCILNTFRILNLHELVKIPLNEAVLRKSVKNLNKILYKMRKRSQSNLIFVCRQLTKIF